MKRLLSTLRSIPSYGWILGFCVIALQYGLYLLATPLSRVLGTIRYAFVPKIPMIDDHFPFISVFVVIYLYSYVFWISGIAIASLTGKRNYINFIVGLLTADILCFLILVLAPTYMDRAAEGLIAHTEEPGFFNWVLALVYRADGGIRGYNLFPSLHCMASLYCYMGIRRRPEIPRGIRIYSLITVILICMSVVFIKQHYFIDTVVGLLIPIVCREALRKLDPAGLFLSKKPADDGR